MMPMAPLMPGLNPGLNSLLGTPLSAPSMPSPVAPLLSPFANFSNPFLQNFPLQKMAESDKMNGGFPTVMVPGIGPCMMIPTAMNEEKSGKAFAIF